jgi:hypothetical protein
MLGSLMKGSGFKWGDWLWIQFGNVTVTPLQRAMVCCILSLIQLSQPFLVSAQQVRQLLPWRKSDLRVGCAAGR